jgi:hypothetical protein
MRGVWMCKARLDMTAIEYPHLYSGMARCLDMGLIQLRKVVLYILIAGAIVSFMYASLSFLELLPRVRASNSRVRVCDIRGYYYTVPDRYISKRACPVFRAGPLAVYVST